jgi:hypothetical protein
MSKNGAAMAIVAAYAGLTRGSGLDQGGNAQCPIPKFVD